MASGTMKSLKQHCFSLWVTFLNQNLPTDFPEEPELITPCFCAGADQSIAEIRAASIRGELRWWFRALGGSREEEQSIFGGIAGDSGKSSAIVVRVSNVRPAKRVVLPNKLNNKPGDPFYLLYFAYASGDGERYYDDNNKPDGYFSPGTLFKLKILARRAIDSELFTKALETFLLLGAIGLRSTRACGAMCAAGNSGKSFDDFKSWIKTLPESVEVVWLTRNKQPAFSGSWKGAFEAESCILKAFRKQWPVGSPVPGNPTPLGRAGKPDADRPVPRQASAVRLRPVKIDGKMLPVVVYVPKVLGEHSKDSNLKVNGFEIGSDVLQN